MNAKVSELLKLLEGRLATINRKELMSLLKAKSKHHRNYSFNNMILAGLQLCRRHGVEFSHEMFSNLWLAPFPIWQRWGYRIMQGERALGVLVPFMVKNKKKAAAVTSEHGNVEKRIIGFGVKPVFDISQTERATANDDALHRRISKAVANISYDDLINRIEAAGLRVVSRPLREGEGGHISENVITLNSNNSIEARCCTLLHELAHHCLGHTVAGNTQERSVEELEAEATAFVVGNQVGIDIPSEFYIAAWGGDGSKIRKSLSHIERAVEKVWYIIGLVASSAERSKAA